MATDTYTLEYVAKIEKLQAELAKIPGATDRSALAAAQALERRMAAASAKAGKAIDHNIGGSLKKLAMGSGFGGLAGDIEDLADGIGGLTQGFSATAMVAGGATAALALTAAGLYKATEATGALKDEQNELARSTTHLTANLGSVMPSAFEGATNALAGFVGWLDAAATGMRTVVNVAGGLADEMVTTAALVSGSFDSLWLSNDPDKWREGVKLQQSYADALRDRRGFIGAMQDAKGATVLQVAEVNALAKSMEDAKKPAADLATNIAAMAKYRNFGPEQETPAQAYAREQREISERRAKAEKEKDAVAAADRQRAADLARWSDDVFRLNAENIGEIDGIRQAAADSEEARRVEAVEFAIAEAEAYAEIIGNLNEENDKKKEKRKESRLTAMAEISDATMVAGAIGKLIEDRAGRSKKAAMVGFRIQQGAALAEVALSTITAVMEAAPNPFAMALAGASGAVAAGAVVASPPPKFHQGGTMQSDEGVAIVRQGERVLTERGARDYDQSTADLNRGGGMRGGGGRVMFEGRDLDVMLARVVRQHGATRRELDTRRGVAAGGY